MRVLRLAACAAALLTVVPAMAGGVKSQLNYDYYAVEGRSPLEVINSMLSSGPRHGDGHAYATTKVDVEPQLSYAEGAGCRAGDLTLQAEFTITLPRHRAPAMMTSSTRAQYDRLLAMLKTHELKHEKIFNDCMQAMHRQIMALPPAPSCVAFSRQVKEISDREWARCGVLNQALDEHDGARHDTLPLIADALKDVARAEASVAFSP
ncbi:MAG: DUF922 domain-containing protein, partial [Flavobacteriaceae bacterium]